jgi:adenine-specific DNA-methyltransferase
MDNICRLNYIGSKFKLLDWITSIMKDKMNITSFEGITVADLFSGTGIVSYHFRTLNAITISNDAELYSYIISSAFTNGLYTNTIIDFIDKINKELLEGKYKNTFGFITKNYSPYEDCERMFFTVDNAQRIDYIKERIYNDNDISTENYIFLLASLLLSADNVSNVPAVYGCFLKNFKSKATKELKLKPIHTNENKPKNGCKVYNSDILKILDKVKADIVYLDPPYNERQYSKNYFPLNMIALNEDDLKEETLKGKTGIPESCFMSSFCRKKEVENSFEKVLEGLKNNVKWIFISYNSESLIDKDTMIKIMSKYGDVSVEERDYKRFKSFEYNEDKSIEEYLFCLKLN